jgi:hypothetical protein
MAEMEGDLEIRRGNVVVIEEGATCEALPRYYCR